MKKCLMILLLGLISFIPTALAQETPPVITTAKPLICHDTKEILRVLAEEYEEEPILMGVEPLMLPNGQAIKLRIQLWVNAKKGSYTIVQTPPQLESFKGKMCILSAGQLEDISEKGLRILLGDQFI